jgi:2-polyprenyl-3-methyl-5-hydroxy-6-metoxy-1,4-benzoquinol methylase
MDIKRLKGVPPSFMHNLEPFLWALDLACSTAVVSHLLDKAGFCVTGIDWSEALLKCGGASQGAGVWTVYPLSAR